MRKRIIYHPEDRKKSLNTEKRKNPVLGLLQWFHIGDKELVKRTIDDLDNIGIKELRTGVSWADYYTPPGEEWYDWLIPELGKHVNILPCFLYTPPSLGIKPKSSSPPRVSKDFADFIDLFINRHGKYFEWVELWNEPNNRSEYDYTLDHYWNIFCDMISKSSYWAKHLGKKTLLGGMSPVDPNWLMMMAERNALTNIDAIGLHGFPHVFDQNFTSWNDIIDQVTHVLDQFNLNKEIWITESGYSTWQHNELLQVKAFVKLMNAEVSRAYWYSLYDLSPELPTVDGFHVDEREYHFGMKNSDGSPKLLYRLIEENGVDKISNHTLIKENTKINTLKKATIITGGAGFVGTNLADRLLSEGKRVIIYDNLTRKGVLQNVEWLKTKYKDNFEIVVADVRNPFYLQNIMNEAEMVYHFAAQVAVTTSLSQPRHDFNTNLQGTFNLLEAIRMSKTQPPVVFTSTNKVYGSLEDIELVINNDRYEPKTRSIRDYGINESRSLEFHSPYGCSKGSADQYILDYARSFGLDAVVFRMSCIYGPHQFGNEDQGWVAHFLITTLKNNLLTIYGDGKQVRDILFVEDLVNAFILARDHMKTISGEAFNIGGGPDNAVSLIELIKFIEVLEATKLKIRFDKTRTGDQKYYVSDTTKFSTATGWKANVNIHEGVKKLYNWLNLNHPEIKSSKKNTVFITK